MIEERDILKYLQGQASQEEELAIRKWIAEDEQNQRQLEFYQRIWIEADLAGEIRLPDVDAAWNNLDYDLFSSRPSHQIRWWSITSVAATILIILGLTLYIFYPRDRYIHHITGNNAEQIQLSDGSLVQLSPGTQILYPESFSKLDSRQIELITGDIHIEVIDDESKPFRVEVYPAGISVKGTIFKARTDSVTAVVENLQGLIRFFDLNDESKGQDVEEGQIVQFDGSEFKDITPAPPPPPEPPPGRLFTVDQIIEILQWRYPVRTEFTPYMKSYPGRIRLDTGQNLDGMIQQMDSTAQLDYIKRGNRYIFYGIRPIDQ